MAIAFLHEGRYHSGHVGGMDAHLAGFLQGVILNAKCQAVMHRMKTRYLHGSR